MALDLRRTLVYAAGLAIALLAVFRLFTPNVAALTYTRPAEVAPVSPLDSAQQAWLGRLEQCESGGNPSAINPRDLDGTPSYGLLQFKPGTYYEFSKLYGLSTSTNYMDAPQQQEIVEQMIVRGGVDWHQQFPACTKRLGLPPVNQ